MLYSTIIASFASLALAQRHSQPPIIGPFSLQVQSSDAGVNNKYVSLAHEGAGINYAFASGTSDNKLFQLNGSILTTAQNIGFPSGAYLPPNGGFLQLGVVQEPGTSHYQYGYNLDKDNLLNANGSYDWFACTNAGDPYNYDMPGIIFGPNTHGDCSPIQLSANF